MNFENYYLQKKKIIEEHLVSFLDSDSRIVDSMKYVLTNGGKRIRSVICLMIEDICKKKIDNNNSQDIIKIACSIEYFHSYSLVHDDLPAMDDDDLRRGKLTCHKYFDEETAILCGDALQTKGFEILTTLEQKENLAEIISLLAKAIGEKGMIGGQMLDLLSEKKKAITLDELKNIHDLKTGKLLEASLLAPLVYCQEKKNYQQISNFGKTIGLLFQVVDDILDVTQSSEQLGKPSQSDIRNEKATYVKFLTLEKAKEYALQLVEDSKSYLKEIDNNIYLERLADFFYHRKF